MAGEIQVPYVPGATLYATVNDTSGRVCRVSTPAFEAFSGPSLAAYVVPLTDRGDGVYLGAMPVVPAGVYGILAKIQVGASPAADDPFAAGGDAQWDGTRITWLASRATPGDGMSLTTGERAATAAAVAAAVTADEHGDGAVEVDQNYGGTDALTVMTAGGVRVDNATILVYLKSDYAAGRRDRQYVVVSTTTTATGAWAAPVMLDPGDYTLLIYKQGVIKARAVNLTVR